MKRKKEKAVEKKPKHPWRETPKGWLSPYKSKPYSPLNNVGVR